MSYEESIKTAQKPHNVIMENRRRLSISGVSEVDSFDESAITLRTVDGALIIRGSELKVGRLTLETGDVSVTGLVSQLSYEEAPEGRSLWTKLFR